MQKTTVSILLVVRCSVLNAALMPVSALPVTCLDLLFKMTRGHFIIFAPPLLNTHRYVLAGLALRVVQRRVHFLLLANLLFDNLFSDTKFCARQVKYSYSSTYILYCRI